MSKASRQIDDYICDAPDFAQPILKKLRVVVHKGCPKAVEVIKWGCPYFEHNGLLCGMAAFKAHVGFGFWRANEMEDPENLFESGTGKKASMCSAKFLALKDMPTQKVLVDYVRRAKKLNEEAVKNAPTKKPRKKIVVPTMPPRVTTALKQNKQAKSFFDSLAPSHQRDYLDWIIDAKRDATAEKRVGQMIEWLCEGKRRNWKYEC
jgi:hypothetical protein